MTINRFEAAVALIESGISVNRNPDATSDGVVSLHNGVQGALGTQKSPGLCVNGQRFENECMPE